MSEDDRALLYRFVAKLRALPEVEAVVLFGSFARGDIDRRSDMDLLVVVDVKDPAALRPRVARMIGEMKPHREISPTLTNLRDLEPSFLRNVLREGIVLHGKLVLGPGQLALRPHVLVAYDLSRAEPSEKVHVSRLVRGFRSKKSVGGKKRVYEYPGLKDLYSATLVSRSVLLLKTEDAEGFLRELDKRKVPYSRWDVYL